ncbi:MULTISPECIES: DUF4439 domain-containing protein [unclassified Arthrobacter]|uniref:DUF4439 domain-containing protein n=1 Tax=unclassified Arthrobacter TaxID=235627 RepID=UPI0024DFE11C|nr:MULTISPECIES: DUF4439 domain-containing protein [unclassified Arthrobacter]MCC9146260.1 DUF4439 domain-containing protein [Arthrobacter sp. zg-Y919]MDK1277490.1 DUF4439 domain-containing protein [Arthrobacter sp. zg.Y919]WIB03978.1 DUF4439 domain-containing protein [Arthrobacter sp. zg-Y919]
MALSTVVDAPLENPGAEPGRARGRGRWGARVRRLVLFLALGAVVLSFGLVAGSGDAADSTRTFSDLALTQAQADAGKLAAEARVLAAQGGNGGAAEFTAQAEGLRSQAALLTGLGRHPAAVPTRRSSEEPLHVPGGAGTDGTGSGTPAAGTGPDRRNLDHYVQALAASAQANLQAAWRADAGTARLLAATGAAQQVWATRNANRYGLTLPDEEFPGTDGGSPAADTEPSGTGAGPDASACPDAQRPEPGSGSTQPAPDGDGSGGSGTAAPGAADALTAAIDAEFGAAYAYEVAFAQAPSAAERGEQWRERAAAHESSGTDAVAYLAELCLPAIAPVAAYRLDAGFLRNPADALPALEEQFPAVYADLVALSDGNLRGWAIARLADVSEDLYLQADTVPATPGLDAVPENLPWN